MIKKICCSILVVTVFSSSYCVTLDEVAQNTQMLGGMIKDVCEHKMPQTSKQLDEQYRAIMQRDPSVMPKYKQILMYCIQQHYIPRDVLK